MLKTILRPTNHLLSSCCTVLPQLLLHSTGLCGEELVHCVYTSESCIWNACSFWNRIVILCCKMDMYTWVLIFVKL